MLIFIIGSIRCVRLCDTGHTPNVSLSNLSKCATMPNWACSAACACAGTCEQACRGVSVRERAAPLLRKMRVDGCASIRRASAHRTKSTADGSRSCLCRTRGTSSRRGARCRRRRRRNRYRRPRAHRHLRRSAAPGICSTRYDWRSCERRTRSTTSRCRTARSASRGSRGTGGTASRVLFMSAWGGEPSSWTRPPARCCARGRSTCSG